MKFGLKTTIICLLATFSTGASAVTPDNPSSRWIYPNPDTLRFNIAASVEKDNLVWSHASLNGLLSLVGGGYNKEAREILAIYFGCVDYFACVESSPTAIERAASAVRHLNKESEGLTLRSISNIWVQDSYPIKDGYLDYIDNYFDISKPGLLDPNNPTATANDINQWAADSTNDMITEVVKPAQIRPDLSVLLANALYFKGSWAEEFNPEETGEGTFQSVSYETPITVEETVVPTMVKRGSKIQTDTYSDDVNGTRTTVVRLPYKGGEHAMYIAFAARETETNDNSWAPRITDVDASVDVMEIYRKQFTVNGGLAFRRSLDSTDNERSLDKFTMPKFTIESDITGIVDTLIGTGANKPLFAEGALSEMTSDRYARLSNIYQKAKIIVNEEGSEAAAVTVGEVTRTSASPRVELHINGPFAYAIRDDKNGVTLFEGVVRNPNTK